MMLLDGILLWLAIVAVVLVVGFEVIWERSGLAVVTMVAGAFAIWFLSGAVNLLPWLRNNWDTILFVIMAHVVIGALWSIVNWRLFFLPEMYEKYEVAVKDWRWAYANRVADKTTYPTVESYIDAREKENGYPPMISEHMADLFYWMSWWEIHAFWTLSHKPFLMFRRWFYDVVAGMLNRMSSDYFAKRKANG